MQLPRSALRSQPAAKAKAANAAAKARAKRQQEAAKVQQQHQAPSGRASVEVTAMDTDTGLGAAVDAGVKSAAPIFQPQPPAQPQVQRNQGAPVFANAQRRTSPGEPAVAQHFAFGASTAAEAAVPGGPLFGARSAAAPVATATADGESTQAPFEAGSADPPVGSFVFGQVLHRASRARWPVALALTRYLSPTFWSHQAASAGVPVTGQPADTEFPAKRLFEPRSNASSADDVTSSGAGSSGVPSAKFNLGRGPSTPSRTSKGTRSRDGRGAAAVKRGGGNKHSASKTSRPTEATGPAANAPAFAFGETAAKPEVAPPFVFSASAGAAQAPAGAPAAQDLGAAFGSRAARHGDTDAVRFNVSAGGSGFSGPSTPKGPSTNPRSRGGNSNGSGGSPTPMEVPSPPASPVTGMPAPSAGGAFTLGKSTPSKTSGRSGRGKGTSKSGSRRRAGGGGNGSSVDDVVGESASAKATGDGDAATALWDVPPPPPPPPGPPTRPSQQQEGARDSLSLLKARADSLMDQAKRLYSAADYGGAVDSYSRALAAADGADYTEGRVKALGNRSAALLMLNRCRETQADCHALLKLSPDNLRIFIRLGTACIRMGQLSKANEAFEKARATSQTQKHALGFNDVAAAQAQMLDRIHAEAKEGIASVFALQDAMERAYDAQRKSRHEDAIRGAEAAMALAPLDSRMHHVRAMGLFKQRRWAQVVQGCEACAQVLMGADPVRTGPSDPAVAARACLHMAEVMGDRLRQIYVPSLRYSERCDDAETVLKRMRHDHERGGAMGAASDGRNDDGEAGLWWRLELRRIENFRQGKDSGDAAFRRGKFHAAVALYTEALEVDPLADSVNSVLFCNRAAAQTALHKYDAAVADCGKALRLRPEYHKARLRRARAYVQMSKFDSAIKDFEEYLREEKSKATAEVESELASARAAERQQKDRLRREAADHREHFNDFGFGFEGRAGGGGSSRQSHTAGSGASTYRRGGTASSSSSSSSSSSGHRYSGTGRGGASSAYGDGQHRHSHSRSGPGGGGAAAAAVPKEQTHYAVLGIPPTATAGEVKKAYLKLALKTHPDKNKAPGAEEAFKLVNKAKEILTDAAQRRKYDEELRMQGMGGGRWGRAW